MRCSCVGESKWKRSRSSPCESTVNKSLSASSFPYLRRNSNRVFPLTNSSYSTFGWLNRKENGATVFPRNPHARNRNNMGEKSSHRMPCQLNDIKLLWLRGKWFHFPPLNREWAFVHSSSSENAHHNLSVTNSRCVALLVNLKKDERDGRPDAAFGD